MTLSDRLRDLADNATCAITERTLREAAGTIEALSSDWGAMGAVLSERHKQERKWGEQNHDPFCYLTILIEEVGEFAQAVLHARFGGHAEQDMQKEAVHVAAVALAIVELLNRGKWYWGRNDGRPAPETWLMSNRPFVRGNDEAK